MDFLLLFIILLSCGKERPFWIDDCFLFVKMICHGGAFSG